MLSYCEVLKSDSGVEPHKCFVKAVDEPTKVEEKPSNEEKDFVKVKKSRKVNTKSKDTEMDPNFKAALEEAQKIFIEECKPKEKSAEIIKNSLEHVANWSGFFLKINTEGVEDEVKIELLDKEYSFSKKRFLSSKYFQNLVIEYYKENFGNVYLRFLPDTKNSFSKIHIKAHN